MEELVVVGTSVVTAAVRQVEENMARRHRLAGKDTVSVVRLNVLRREHFSSCMLVARPTVGCPFFHDDYVMCFSIYDRCYRVME